MPRKPSPRVKKEVLPCKIEMSLASGETFSAEGATPVDALMNLSLDYTQVKSKGTITLYKDGKKAEKFFYLAPLKRIAASKLRKPQVARDLEYLLT